MLRFLLFSNLFMFMRLFTYWVFCISLCLTVGCFESDSPSTVNGVDPSLAEIEVVPDQTEAGVPVVPVKFSLEDQEKAKRAPEGMVFIKGGCYRMGNDFAQEDERPEHEVCVDDFFLDKFEVTQARWNKVIPFNPSKFVGDDLPVEQVNYLDVQKFIQKSNGQCRLPTEAEWEYAARGGGTDRRYYWGNMMDEAYAWFQDNSADQSHPVGQKLPNQFGLHDMMGNVWEWMDDWYEPYYKGRRKDNPQGPETGEFKVVRGGAFDSSAGALRATNRTWLHPKNRVFPKVTTFGQVINEIFNYIGFRCAKSFSEEPAPDTKPKT